MGPRGRLSSFNTSKSVSRTVGRGCDKLATHTNRRKCTLLSSSVRPRAHGSEGGREGGRGWRREERAEGARWWGGEQGNA